MYNPYFKFINRDKSYILLYDISIYNSKLGRIGNVVILLDANDKLHFIFFKGDISFI